MNDIGGMPADEQGLRSRPDPSQILVDLLPALLRHDNIKNDRSDGVTALPEQRNGLFAVRSLVVV